VGLTNLIIDLKSNVQKIYRRCAYNMSQSLFIMKWLMIFVHHLDVHQNYIRFICMSFTHIVSW